MNFWSAFYILPYLLHNYLVQIHNKIDYHNWLAQKSEFRFLMALLCESTHREFKRLLRWKIKPTLHRQQKATWFVKTSKLESLSNSGNFLDVTSYGKYGQGICKITEILFQNAHLFLWIWTKLKKYFINCMRFFIINQFVFSPTDESFSRGDNPVGNCLCACAPLSIGNHHSTFLQRQISLQSGPSSTTTCGGWS